MSARNPVHNSSSGLRIRTKADNSHLTTANNINKNDSKQFQEEDPVTPAGRMFYQPKTNCVILSIFTLQNPIEDIPALKENILNTYAQHKRFSSIIKLDDSGHEKWVRTEIDIDEHVIIATTDNSPEEYTSNLATSKPLDPRRPLWEIHVLNSKSSGALIFRIHHSLGDGISLMSLVLACTKKASNPQELPSIPTPSKKELIKDKSLLGWLSFFITCLWTILLLAWYTLIGVTKFVAVSLFLRDSPTPIKGSAGVERMSKKITHLDLPLEDMKVVKDAAKATVNDVLLGMVSAGITRYLREKLPKQSFKGIRMHATALVNTRQTPGIQEIAKMMEGSSKVRWGNQMGYIMIPILLEEYEDLLDYVRSAKEISDRKKLSLEAKLSYIAGSLVLKLVGAKAASDFIYRTLTQTTMSISNVMGPLEEIAYMGNLVTGITPTVIGQGQALCIHMQTYAGQARLVATAAKDIIPDPEAILNHCKGVLSEMKQAATNK